MAPPTMLMAGDPDELVGQIEEHPVGLPTRWEPGGASRDLGRGLRYEGLKHKPSAPFAPSWTWKRGCARAALYRGDVGAEEKIRFTSSILPIGATAASARRACTAPGGFIDARGARACARARRRCAVSVSIRRSDTHHGSRHRPQQGAGDGRIG
jgi:hypothetical protein